MQNTEEAEQRRIVSASQPDAAENEQGLQSVPAVSRRSLGGGFVTAVAVLGAAVVLAWFLIQNHVGAPSLPAGFPSQNELPLVDGEVINAAQLPGSQVSITVQVAGVDQQNDAISVLREAGYRVIASEGSGPIGTTTSLSSDMRSVRVAFAQAADGTFTVQYLTAPHVSSLRATTRPDSDSAHFSLIRGTETS